MLSTKALIMTQTGYKSMIYLKSEVLSNAMKQVLNELDLNNISMNHVVDSLIQTSLRGVDSHGINLFPHYCRAIKSGRINNNPNIEIKQTGDSSAIVDADHAFGHHVGAVAMDYAVKLAKNTGIAAVNVKNSTHFGAAAYFGFLAADKDCLGFAFTNADALLKTYGSAEAFFGTNPICFTAPLKDEHHLCLDMATSLVSWNKLMINKSRNLDIPDNWAFDRDGKRVTDPNAAISLNPIGDYKGYGLAMMVDILCGILAGSLTSKDILPMYTSPINEKRYLSHFFMALNVNKFFEVEIFKQNLQNVVNRLRSLDPIDKGKSVMVPGDPEKKFYEIRIQKGIPTDETKYEELLAISDIFRDTVII